MTHLARRSLVAVFLVLALAAPAVAETPISGTVTGEMRYGDQVIALTHVYVMEPFVLPDAPPDPEVARRLIVILADRPYPGDLPPMSVGATGFVFESGVNGIQLEIDRNTGEILYAMPGAVRKSATDLPYFECDSLSTQQFKNEAGVVSAKIVGVRPRRGEREETAKKYPFSREHDTSSQMPMSRSLTKRQRKSFSTRNIRRR
jgi:hypothetical protein